MESDWDDQGEDEGEADRGEQEGEVAHGVCCDPKSKM